jgi:hypothetical protein
MLARDEMLVLLTGAGAVMLLVKMGKLDAILLGMC